MGAADRLRGGREIAARGHLSLDREKAREKLRMFRLPDPHFYVLQFVRAASVLGAKRIEFEITAREMTCSFDRDLPEDLLQDIWGVAFDARTDADAQAMHYIALGIGSAQALNPAHIDICTGSVALRLVGESESFDGRRGGAGTVIHVKEKFRFGHIVEFFTSISGELPEVTALRSRCSFSPLEVRVNGRSNRVLTGSDFSQHQVAFSEEHERGFVALEAVSLDGWCEVLKDGVALSRVAIPNHGKAAIGAMQSTRVQTDLSGLALIESDGWDRSIHEVFIPHYHEALSLWLRTIPRDDVGEQLDALAEIADYARERGGEISRASRELFDRLCEAKLFENALEEPGPPSLSINDVTWPKMARYSTVRYPGLKTKAGRAIALVEPSATGGVVGVRERMLRESVMLALGQSRLRNCLNLTMVLERQATAQRNEALWKARPRHEIGGHRYEREVAVGPRRGVVSVPLNAPHEMVHYDASGFFAYRDARLLRRNESELPITVEVDGDLGVAERFDDVIRDQGFTKLAVQLCVQSFAIYADFAEDLIASQAQERERPRVLDRFIHGLCRGSWCRDFFAMLGFLPATQVPKILEDHAEALAGLMWFAESRPRAEVLQRLGSMASVRSIEMADGTLCSLTDAVSNESLSLLRPTGDWRAFLSKTRQQLGVDVLANIAIVDSVQEQLLRGLRQAPDTRLAIGQLHARARFFEKAKFSQPQRDPDLQLIDHTDWFSATVQLRPYGPPGTCDTTFVWHGRELGTRRFDVPMGSFEAFVYSSELTPTDDYDDVLYDHRARSAQQFVAERGSELLDRWWTDRHERRDLGDSSTIDLFVDIAHELAPRHPDRAIVPVLRRTGKRWETDFVSRTELRSLAARHGLVMSYTRAESADESLLADPATPVIRLGSRQGPTELNALIGQQLRVVDATPVGTSTRLPPALFWESSPRSSGVDGAAFEWSGVIRGLSCHCGIYHDPQSAIDPDAAKLDVTTATAFQLQKLHGIGPALAAAIVLFRGHHGLQKPEDLMRVPGIGPATFDDIKGAICVGEKEGTNRTSNLIAVLVQRRQLESLDVETPMGKFRSTMSGDAIVPDPTYKFAAGGREKILIAAHEVAAKTVREACREARETGIPTVEIVPDLRLFLAKCLTEEVRSPFDLAEPLRAAPLFPTLSGRWLAFDSIGELIRDQKVFWASEGDRDDVLRLSKEELPVAELALGPHFDLAQAMDPWARAKPKRPSTVAPVEHIEGHIEGDPVLDTVVELLLRARADRLDLFDDHLAQRVRWSSVLVDTLCRVSGNGVDVNRRHPMVKAVHETGDLGACAFLASALYSSINAYYREITDHDELELQSRLVRCLDE